MLRFIGIRLFLLVVLFSPLVGFSQGHHCPLEATCLKCKGSGRSYVAIQGVSGCIVCLGFCPVVLEPRIPGQTGSGPTDRRVGHAEAKSSSDFGMQRLLVIADEQIVRSIGQVNPDVAVHLYALSSFSEQATAAMPTVGEGRFSKLHSAEGVDALYRGVTGSELETHWASLPPGADQSVTRYQLTRLTDANFLRMSHRLLRSDGVELAPIHPDVQVNLEWTVSGRSGCWRAISWQPFVP